MELEQSNKEQLVLDNIPLVRAIATRIHANLPCSVDRDDLINAGIIGLIDAADKFDPMMQIAFASYAKYRIRGAILDNLRSLDWASRDMRKDAKRIDLARTDLRAELQREPTEEEVIKKLGIDSARWRKWMFAPGIQMLSYSQPITNTLDDEELFVTVPSKRPGPDAEFSGVETANMLKGFVHALPEKYQILLRLYYEEDNSMKQIGEKFRVNESRISQMHKLALEKLRAAMEEQHTVLRYYV